MNKINVQYHQLLQGIKEYGYIYEDKSRGVKRKEVTSAQLDFDTSYYFPAISTKKLFWKGVTTELLWFLRGESDISFLHKHNVHIWDKDHEEFHKQASTFKNGTHKDFLGNIYGPQWRSFNTDFDSTPVGPGVDQILNLIKGLIENPMNTRHLVTAWNPSDIQDKTLALPACHWAFEVLPRPLYEWEKEEKFPGYEYCFALKWHQRSVDTFLGLPFNIASYGVLGLILEEMTGLKFVSLIGDLSRVHIYEDHNTAVDEQLGRDPNTFEMPRMIFSENFYLQLEKLKKEPLTSKSLNIFFESLVPEDFELVNYKSFSNIKADMLAPKTEKNEHSDDNDALVSMLVSLGDSC